MTTADAANPMLAPVLPPAIAGYIRRFSYWRRRLALERAVGIAAAVFLACLLLQCLVDRFFHLSGWIRAGLLAVNLLLTAGVLWKPLRAVANRRIDWIAEAARVERQNNGFAGKLQTVASQLLERPEYRGSSELLSAIVLEVEADVGKLKQASPFPRGDLTRAWIPPLALLVLLGCLLPITWLGLPLLLGRALRPWAAIAPVTTTHLRVLPGNIDLLQGSSAEIRATTDHPNDEAPILNVSLDGKTWSQERMSATTANQFAFSIPGINQDIFYFVEAGDARSDRFNIHALYKPTVVQFRIHYEYPAYTQKHELSVTNTDGVIEAPVGTAASVSVVCTEPIASAALLMGDARLEMKPTIEPAVWSAQIKIEKSMKLDLDLLSSRHVTGNGPGTMAIIAVPDNSPTIRFVQPVDDLRLTPREIATVAFLGTDDYGLKSVVLEARVNQGQPMRFPARLGGDTRYVEGSQNLDLAPLNLRIGDVVRLSLVAEDGAGHVARSAEDRYVLVSPHGIDLNVQLRLDDARQAERLSADLAKNLADANRTLLDARNKSGGDAGDPAAILQARQDLVSAADTAQMLRQALLRSIVHTNAPASSVALARWADRDQQLISSIDRVSDLMDSVAQDEMQQLVATSAASADRLHQQLKTLADGELARQLILQRQDLSAATRGNVADAATVDEITSRGKEEISSGAKMLGLDAGAPDFGAKLSAVVDASKKLVAGQTVIDFSTAATRWVADLAQPAHREADLAARLETAAQAEAMRNDANLIRARDLQLSARAAAAIAPKLAATTMPAAVSPGGSSGQVAAPGAVPPGNPSPMVAASADSPATNSVATNSVATNSPATTSPAAISVPTNSAATTSRAIISTGASLATAPVENLATAYPAAIAALQKDDDLEKAGAGSRSDADVRQIRHAAADARRKMIEWAGGFADSDLTAAQQQAIDLALQAGAETAGHDYAKAATNDQRLAQVLATQPSTLPAGDDRAASAILKSEQEAAQAVRQSLTSAAAIDQLKQQQDKLTADTNSATADQAKDLARRETEVAEAVRQADALQKSQTGGSPDANAGADQPGKNQPANSSSPNAPDANPGGNPGGAPAGKTAPGNSKLPDADHSGSADNAGSADNSASTNPPTAADNSNRADQPGDVNPADALDARTSAIQTIQAAMERLAAMPGQLSAAQRAAVNRKEAADQNAAANAAVADANRADELDAERSVAAQTAKDLAAASAAQTAAAKPVSPDVTDDISRKLAPLTPEAQAAKDAIDQQLTPSLRELQQAIGAGDAPAIDRSVTAARQSLGIVQDQLRQAQDALVEQDPLVAARWFAQAAAQDLSAQNADLKAAGSEQRNISIALSRAWDQSVQQASLGRLAQIPSMQSIISLYPDDFDNLDGGVRGATGAAPAALPVNPQWGKLRAQQTPALNAAAHDTDPAGYEDSLRAYFQALNKMSVQTNPTGGGPK